MPKLFLHFYRLYIQLRNCNLSKPCYKAGLFYLLPNKKPDKFESNRFFLIQFPKTYKVWNLIHSFFQKLSPNSLKKIVFLRKNIKRDKCMKYG